MFVKRVRARVDSCHVHGHDHGLLPPHLESARLDVTLLLIQIVFFQEFGPERLRRSGNVRPALRRKVHEIPIWPHRVDMIRRRKLSFTFRIKLYLAKATLPYNVYGNRCRTDANDLAGRFDRHSVNAFLAFLSFPSYFELLELRWRQQRLEPR